MHKLLLHPAVPGRIYQQNHVGSWRSDDHGDSWYEIGQGLPTNYGFGLALDAHDPETAFVLPMAAGQYSFRATQGKFTVFKWKGGKKGWTALQKGLPDKSAYLNVLREGMSADTLNPVGVYVGTGTGQVFHTPDGGRSWRTLAQYLPPVLSVSASVV